MAKTTASEHEAWATKWLESVTPLSMTQRSLTVVEKHGGLALVVRLARKHGVHLLRVVDDKGNVLIAASRHRFSVLC